MSEWTTAAGIAATAITLSNVIVWAWGSGWTPQQKAAVGALTALGVFFAGIVLFPAEWTDSSTAFTVLFQALLTVLASAGAPVFREAARREQPEAPGLAATGPDQPVGDGAVKAESKPGPHVGGVVAMIEAHDVPYLVFDVVVAGAFWAALVLLLLTSARHNHWLRKAGLIVITAMAGAFWTAAAVLRVYDHGLPAAVILNWWSRVLYAMLAFYVLGYAWLNWRMRRE